MSRPNTPPSLRPLLWLAGLAFCAIAPVHAAEPVAVFSQVFNNYTRTKLPDGSFKPETYGFGEGGPTTRAVDDPSLDKLPFAKVATAVVGPLARLNYRMTSKPEETDLLIVVFWGATQGSRDQDASGAMDHAASASALANNTRELDAIKPNSADNNTAYNNAQDLRNSLLDEQNTAMWLLSLDNDARDHLDDYNARVLGFTDSLRRARFAAHMSFAQDLLAEISANRYYVVLQAYDFRTAWKLKKLKPLWTARISISEAHKDFGDALAQMVASAAPYFGRDSDGVKHEELREGKVELAPLQIIEVVPGK